MGNRLVLVIGSQVGLAALTVAACLAVMPRTSAAQKERQVTPSFIQIGIGPHEEPVVNPELPVLRHEAEHYYDQSSDRIMLYEEIEYEDGSTTSKIGPHRSELDPQIVPFDVQPPPCTLVVESATNQAFASTGTVHCDASVLCRINGQVGAACSKVGFSLSIYQLQANGLWTRINYQGGTTPMNLNCNNRATPWCNGGVGVAGTFRFKWDGWNVSTNASLWSLTTEIVYEG